ncbi:hypothetical protein DC366_04535 [Pelagivirga sediminicola]|uniref:DUF2169 domain-containing protein n=1 Tax=Pelagivirga sediminicola TaxID=2170575 RepID=A0A2T7G9F7_9RHOB|nr:DUF2169 domain-containing protein [Pelagivirga sediminicola]PVA11045.1 hypothetical protein DC366_04535 [Pelagivirga sediminicola]
MTRKRVFRHISDRFQPPSLRDLAGTFDATWQAERAPLLPADLDPGYWQSVQPEQQIPRPVTPDDPLVLTGFGLADGAYMLPHLDLHCATRIAGEWTIAPTALQGIALDLNSATVSLTYLETWPIASAAKDVDISQTRVMLNEWNSFHVRPDDIGHFARSAQVREAS